MLVLIRETSTPLTFPVNFCNQDKPDDHLQTLRVLVEQGQPEILPRNFPLSVDYPPSPAKAWLLRREGKYLTDLPILQYAPFLYLFILFSRDVETVEALVLSGYEINESLRYQALSRNFDGWSIMHVAFRNDGDNWLIGPRLEYLLSKGAKIHNVAADGQTPTSRTMEYPLKFARWVQALLEQEDFNLSDFCSAQLASEILLGSLK
jgi:hypothetical protein